MPPRSRGKVTSLTGGCVVPSAQPVLRPPPTPTRPATYFPRSSVIKRRAPATHSAGHRAGEGLTSSRRHYPNVPRPIRREVLQRLRIQVFSAFHGLRPDFGGSALPAPAQTDGPLTTPQASRNATDRSVAPPQGLSTLGFDLIRFQTKPPVATGPPDSYPDRTHTGKRRRAYDQRSPTQVTSDLLVARKIEAK